MVCLYKFPIFLLTIFRSWSVVELEQSFFHTDLPLSVSSSFSLIDSGPCSSVESRLPGLDRPAHAVALCQHCHSIFWKVSTVCQRHRGTHMHEPEMHPHIHAHTNTYTKYTRIHTTHTHTHTHMTFCLRGRCSTH